MAVQTETVTGFISGPNGAPLTSGSVRFRLSRYDIEDGGVVTSANDYDTLMAIQSDGSIAGTLWPNTAGNSNTSYKVTILNDKGQPLETLGSVTIGEEGPYELGNLIEEFVFFAQETLFRVMTKAEYDAVIAAEASVSELAPQVAEDAAQVAEDAAQTAEDRVQTGQDAAAALAAKNLSEQARDSAATSVAGAGAPAWVSGTTYAIGDVRYSPVTFKTYRRRTAGAGTVDPSADKANWSDLTVPLSGDGVLTNLNVTSGLSAKYATLNGTALTSGHFAEFQEQGKRALRNILGAAAAAYDFTDYLALDGAQAAFTDTAGTAALTTPGTSLARMNDATANAANAVQANAGQRLLFGRAPREVRNLLTWTEDFTNGVWSKGSGSITATNIADPIGGNTADVFTSSGISAILSNLTSVTVQSGGIYTASVWLKVPSGTDTILLSITTASFSILQSVNCSVTASWQRFTVSGSVGANTAIKILIGGSNTIGIGDVVHVWGAQLEIGSVATPYQRVGVATDVTETGVPSYTFARFDNSDDALVTTLPDGHTGDLIIFGRKGTWKEANTVAAAGTFTLGGTIAGTPATPGIMRAIGDVAGYLLTGKTLTDEETRRLTQYYASRGAKGLLVPGPELAENGTFDVDLTSWTTLATGASSAVWNAGGWADLTNVDARVSLYQNIPVAIGDTHVLTLSNLSGATVTMQYYVGSSFGQTDIIAVSSLAEGETVSHVFKATTTVASVFARANSAGTARLDNVSVRALTPQEAF